MIIFDASVLAAYLDGDETFHDAAEALLADAIDEDFGVNTLTLAEVLVVPARTGRLEAVTSALHDVEMNEVPFPPETAVRLARLRVDTGLKMPDCCVILAAEDSHATIATFDDRLLRAAEDRNLAVLGR